VFCQYHRSIFIEGAKEDKVYDSVKREEIGRDVKTGKENMRKFINVKRKTMR
jgi:hypothetical protein